MKKRSLGSIAVLSLIIALAVPAEGSDLQRVSLMLDWFPNPDHVPIYVAKEKGYFRSNGLDVEILVPADPNDPLKLTAAGKMDFAVNYQPSLIIARSEGLPLVSVGALVQHPLSTIMYLKGSGIRRVKDLKGRRIGYSVAPLYEVLFKVVAERAGLKEGDYELIHVGFNLVPGLLSGKVDAVVGAFRNYEKIQIEQEGRQVGLFPLEENGVPDFYELILVTAEKTVRRRPELVGRFMNSIKRGIITTIEESAQAFELFLKVHSNLRNELNRRSFEATLPFFKGSPAQSVERWRKMHDFMLDRGLIRRRVEINKLMTTRFSN